MSKGPGSSLNRYRIPLLLLCPCLGGKLPWSVLPQTLRTANPDGVQMTAQPRQVKAFQSMVHDVELLGTNNAEYPRYPTWAYLFLPPLLLLSLVVFGLVRHFVSAVVQNSKALANPEPMKRFDAKIRIPFAEFEASWSSPLIVLGRRTVTQTPDIRRLILRLHKHVSSHRHTRTATHTCIIMYIYIYVYIYNDIYVYI